MICSLRPWRPDDAACVAQNMNNLAVLNNLRDGIPYPYTEQDGLNFINSMLSAKPDSTYAFAIVLDDDRPVGSIGVFRCGNIHFRTAEMGYYVAQPYWGRGIGTCAVTSMCRYIFENTDILRIFAEPFSFNAASRRVLEKSGFELEGIMRKNAVKNGEVLDMCLYARLKN